ncbi:DUF4159 domain-containing protein [Actibacterium pelagium]|uniref:LytTR family transcriptional regulator n=1 Tax=Actibacterium pelagium TaxID=2029103 RepID=A0A917EJZ8_9RHOB|nr:DUF4159 domain-containing protein [Actibacterium pelagium]GGE53246.1 LytTR family transcriptional regulator [Actibacterium pelagium]
MFTLGPIGFTAPWLLAGLAALPILWLLLRAVPPAPIKRRFPGVALLLGLTDDETQSDRTPWWLLLLRTLAIAAIILGFAGPVLNPSKNQGGSGPLLVLIDGGWADARDWSRRMDRVEVLLEKAATDGRPVALALATELPEEGLQFQPAREWAAQIPGLAPHPWDPINAEVIAWADGLEGRFDTFWLSNGLDADWRTEVLGALDARGAVQVFESPGPAYGLRPPVVDDSDIVLTVLRDRAGANPDVALSAIGLDPNGVERELEQVTALFEEGENTAEARMSLPPELRNRVTRFAIAGQRSAGAVVLGDDSLKRREIAMIAGREQREGLQLLSPLHYLDKALRPSADLLDGALLDILPANPDVLILADVATVAEAEEQALLKWTEAGGLLLRFAGPRLAASDVSRAEEDPLLPVRLRAGGRNVGGAMSWGEPKALRPFAEGSLFYGLGIPEDVRVSSQVMAQPGPELAERVLATLSDGTPLVTRKPVGQGQVVLFHVTANAEWSTLPLSGLFVQMLERLAVSSGGTRPSAEELEGTTWVPEQVLTGFGQLEDAGIMPGVPGERLAAGQVGPDLMPGLYSGGDRRLSVNVIAPDRALSATNWPASVPVEGLETRAEQLLKGHLLTLALILLAVDMVASMWLSGRLRGARQGFVALIALMVLVPDSQAQEVDDQLAFEATEGVVLAHVLTGDASVDEMARAGLVGLSRKLTERTAVEPLTPIAVDLERDELAFFPFLYWPITANQELPSNEAYTKLNRYLRTGGLILFDTRDGNLGNTGAVTPEGRRLQLIARPLDIPPLEPVPEDHVLTRTFYLLQGFPGRHNAGGVWVEAAPPDAELAEGMPFRNLNDGVTPVVIGGNDWAAAWAIDAQGAPMYPVGRGYAGARQREIAYRFGINLIMHVLTGNYKSDQVHVPALLERLGQ